MIVLTRGWTIVIVCAALVSGVPARTPRQPCKYEENCDCRTPGITVRWKAAYCMAVNQTDDLEQAGVQRCLSQRDPAAIRTRSACAQNLYWKTRLCGELHKGRRSAVDECVKDRAMIPRIVDHGPGGAP
jgi:hypothetical protein